MFNILTSLAFVGLTAALPLEPRQDYIYPEFFYGAAFTLIANVSNLATDLDPPIHNWVLASTPTGVGLNTAILQDAGDDQANPRILYQNGTETEYYLGQSQVLTDGGCPVSAYSIGVQQPYEALPNYPDEHGVTVNRAPGSTTRITRYPGGNAYAFLELMIQGQGSFTACSREIPESPGKTFITVEYVYATYDEVTWLPVITVPEGCTAIRLIPQCAALNDLTEGSGSSHDNVLLARCYEHVAGIDWPAYGP